MTQSRSFAALVHASCACARRAPVVPKRRSALCWVGLRYLMVKFVGICVVLFVLAVGLIVVNQPQDMAALFAAFRSEPLAAKAGLVLVVLIPLLLIPSALWLCDALLRQRKRGARARIAARRRARGRQGTGEVADRRRCGGASSRPHRSGGRHRRGRAAARRSRRRRRRSRKAATRSATCNRESTNCAASSRV